MKPIVKKILEAGLVDKHIALLMEKWKSVDDGAAELVGKEDIRKASESSLLQFAEEIEQLLDESRSLHETKLSITVKEPFAITWVLVSEPSSTPASASLIDRVGTQAVVFRDEMGNFVFPPGQELMLRAGNRFRLSDGAVWSVVDFIPLFVGEQKYAYQVEAIEVDLG